MTAALQSPLGRVPLESPRITLGRAMDNKVVVSDPKASGHHAVIELYGQSYSVTDLGSTNGTFVNEQKLDHHIPQFLKTGDKIRIGDSVFAYEYQPDPPSLEDTAIRDAGHEPTMKAPPGYHPGLSQEFIPSQPADALASQQDSPSQFADPSSTSATLGNIPVQPAAPQNNFQPSQPDFPASSPPDNFQTSFAGIPPATPSSPSHPPFSPSSQLDNSSSTFPSFSVPPPYNPGFPAPNQNSSPSNPAFPSHPSNPSNPAFPAPYPAAPNQNSSPYNPAFAPVSQPFPGPAPYNQPTEQFGDMRGQPWNNQSSVHLPPGSAPSGQPAFMPMPAPGFVPPQQQKTNRNMLYAIIAIIVVVILVGAGGTGYYLATRPKPVITVTSDFHSGAALAGATDTSFKVTGVSFSSSSAVTFLLDGRPVPGMQPVISDDKGNITTTLKVTSDWTVGDHTLTAKDASDYKTQQEQKIKIVQQGDAHTPGPNNAPPNDAKGRVNATITVNGGGSSTETLNVNTSTSGTVCTDTDDGQPHVYTQSTASGVPIKLTLTTTCSGSYKGGKLTYVQTATNGKLEATNGALTCTLRVPFENQHLEGTFSNSTTVNGTYTSASFTMDCDHNVGTQTVGSGTGSWTGVAIMS